MANFPTYGVGATPGVSFPQYGRRQATLDSAEGLYQLAQMQGGAVAQAANEIYHPSTGILSSIGAGMKNAFRGFVDIISTPSHVMAGLLSSEMTVGDAMKDNITPSDVIFGDKDPDGSIYKKTGSFLIRTAVDILLDPLTYVTFGASTGALGLRAGTKITLHEGAAKAVGKKALATASLSDEGQKVYSYVSKLQRQMTGATSAQIAKTGDHLLDLAGKELEGVMKATIDSPLSIDYAKKAMTALIEKNPAYIDTLLDKGGIKFFGKSILSGQRISSTLKMVPGMTHLDQMTQQSRLAVGALFDPTIVKGLDNQYVRLPMEYVEMHQKWGDFARAYGEEKIQALDDIMKRFKLNESEARFLTASLEYRRVPTDPRLAGAFKATLGFNDLQWESLVKAGVLTKEARIEGHVPHILVKESVGSIKWKMPPSTATGAAELRKMARFVDEKTGATISGHADELGLKVVTDKDFVANQQVVFRGGGALDVKQVTDRGVPTTVSNKVAEDFARIKNQFDAGRPGKILGRKEGQNIVEKYYISPSARIATKNDIPDSVYKAYKESNPFVKPEVGEAALGKWAKANGYDAIDYRTLGKQSLDEAEIKILNTKILKTTPHTVDGGVKYFKNANGDIFRREVEPLHKVAGEKAFDELEGTLLKNPKNAAKLLDDMRQEGFQGFDDNAITALAARSLKNSKAISMKYFLRELGENFGADAATVAASGYKRINNAGLEEAIQVLGKEGELMFHPAIAAHVEKFMGSLLTDDATMDFLKAYDSLQNAWKATVTSIWPAFHGRNALSNVFQNFLDIGYHAVNPRTHAMSISLLKADRQLNKLSRLALGTGDDALRAQAKQAALLGKEMFTDATGYKWTFGELRQVAKNNNIAFTKAIVTSNDVQKGQQALVKALFPAPTIKGKIARGVAKPFEIGQDVVGRTLEEQARLVNFLSNLKNTGDVTMAAARTKQFLFDYSNLTNFERMFMRRLIPFYTFTRKNLELQIRALVTTPGRVAAEVHAISTLGEVISGGEQLSSEEYAALPDWVKAGMGILLKKNGDQITMITSLGTPLEAAFAQTQANVVLGSVSPLLRVPVEQMAGYSFFQGKPLSEATNAAAFQRAPKFIQDLIGFTEVKGRKSDGTPYTWYVSLHPEMMNLVLNLPPTTRVFTALKQMDAVDVDEQAKVFQQLTGVRPYSFDLERERAKREKEMMSQLENILTKAGVTAQFKRTFIPKEKKKLLYPPPVPPVN